MSRVRVLVADDDLNMHQVVEDIIDICFREVDIERVMTYPALLAKLRVHAESFDIILFDLHLHQPNGGRALPMILAEFPGLRNRLVVIAPADEDTDVVPEAKGLPRVGFPFSLDEFTRIVRAVYEGSGPVASRQPEPPPASVVGGPEQAP